MKGDFSRWTFNPAKHFSGVLMQQGRVTLDADHNEQAAIFLHALRVLTRDLFGPYGGPADGGGFGLMLTPAGATTNLNLLITPGHYYVNGILCECEDPGCYYAAQTSQGQTESGQPDYTPPANDPFVQWLANPQPNQSFWIYLDVWQRHITWVEDDSIREVALGGPDTCTRSKTVWQVKALPWNAQLWGATPSCQPPLSSLPGLSDATLAARLDPGALPTDPCVLAPDAKYRGAENQLYRVEVHRGGSVGDTPGPTFKWSRDNGSVVVPWLDVDGNDLVVLRTRGFEAGIWVELSDDGNDLNGTPGQLVKLVKVDGDRLSIDPASIPGGTLIARNANLHPKVRRWDQSASDAIILDEGAVPITEGGGVAQVGNLVVWGITLEDGLQIRFGQGGQYRTGDYWLIPARVATGSIEWPTTLDAQGNVVPQALPPMGIEHFYAPLGTVSSPAGALGGQVQNCRNCMGVLPNQDCPSVAFTNDAARARAAAPSASVSATAAKAATAPSKAVQRPAGGKPAKR